MMTAVVVRNSILKAAQGSLDGPTMIVVADAVASAVSGWMVGLSGTAVGSAGVGKVTGNLSVQPAPGIVLQALVAAGVKGPLATVLATVLANGVSEAASTGTYSGTSFGVAVGTDTSKVTTADVVVLSGLLAEAFGSAAMADILSIGIANGLAAMLLSTGTGSGQVAGVPTVPTTPATAGTVSLVV